MIYCKKCGTKLPDDAVYCIKCGTKVDHLIDEHIDDDNIAKEIPDLSSEADKLSSKDRATNSDSSIIENEYNGSSRNKHGRRFWGVIILALIIFIGLIPLITSDDTKSNSTPQVQQSSSAEQSAAAKKADEEKAAAEKKAHEEAIKPPVTLNKVTVKPNSIGAPEVNLSMTNHSGKTIDAYKILIYAYDNYGTQLQAFGFGKDAFSGISQDPIGDDETTSPSRYWTLNGFDNGRKFVVRLMSIHFSDGTEWNTEDGQEVTIEGKMGS